MPGIVTLPGVPETGYQGLASALLGGSTDYARLKIQKDEQDQRRTEQLADEARRRQQQLDDVSGSRAYETKRAADERTAHVQDVEAEKLYAAKVELIRLGYLSPDQIDDRAAVGVALKKFHDDGLLTRYKGAFESGDLTYADLGDESKVAAGLAKFSARQAQNTTRGETSLTNAQSEADSLKGEYDLTVKQTRDLESQLSQPVEAAIAAPAPAEIEAAAVQLAQQAMPGKTPSRQDIAAQMPIAAQALQQSKLEAVMLRRQQTQERVKVLRDSLTSLGSRLTNLANHGVYPSSDTEASTTVAEPTTAAAPVNFDSARKSALAALLKPQSAAAPAPTGEFAALPNPTNEPLIATENNRRVGQNWQTNLADPYNAALDRVEAAKQKVASIRTGAPVVRLVPTGEGPIDRVSTPVNPSAQAAQLSSALMELDTAQQDAEKARRAMLNIQDPTVAAATPQVAPPISNATSTTPFAALQRVKPWWQSQTPQTAAGF